MTCAAIASPGLSASRPGVHALGASGEDAVEIRVGGDWRLDAVELVVDAGEGDRDRLLGGLEGGVDALASATDDLGQQIDHGGEE